jgi:glycosyltransferase involved in cell wall biosynthesis
MKPPAISVALCTWNRAQLLDEAIRALAGQDAPPPHEILIVDNGSTDATRDIVMRAAARHPVIRYRGWHYRHGRLIARMRRTGGGSFPRGRFRDVPVHLLRQAARDAWDVTRQILTGRTVEAFEGETRRWFVAGFVRERWT